MSFTHNLKPRLKHLAKRYLPAEITGTIGAFSAAWIMHAFTGNILLAAIAGTWGENIGFYGYHVLRELRFYHDKHRAERRIKKYSLVAYKSLRNLLIEFGPAEVADTLFVRPFFMYLMPSLLNNFSLGIITGKLMADVVFYSLTIPAYRLRLKLSD